VREGDWKLVWQTALPSRIELFNLAQDPSEKNNLAEKNPQKVAELQQRIQKLAQEAAQPLFLKDALGATKHVLFGSVAMPDQEKDLEMQPLTVRYLAKNARRDSISCFYVQAPDDSLPFLRFCHLQRSSRYCVLKTMEKIPPGLARGLGPHLKYRKAGLSSADCWDRAIMDSGFGATRQLSLPTLPRQVQYCR